MDRTRIRDIDVDQLSRISDRIFTGGNYDRPVDGNDAHIRNRGGYCGGGPRLCNDSRTSMTIGLISEASNVIHDMPDVVGTDAGFAVESFHRGSKAVADIDED